MLDSGLLEAIAKIRLDNRGADDGGFVYSPYWIDALLHLAGFIMNGNDALDCSEAVYISHGWQGLRFAKPLVPAAEYQAYVRMLPRDKTVVGGNVWMLRDGEVVDLAEDLRFQRVPRTVLDLLLPPVGVKSAVLRKTASKPSVVLPDRAPEKTLLTKESQAVSRPAKGDTFLDTIAAELGLEPSEVSPDDTLSDLGVDSLMSLTLASNLVEQFGLSISHADLMSAATICDLLALLHDKQGTAPTPAAPGAKPHARILEQAQPSSSSSTAGETSTSDSTTGDTAEFVRTLIIEETGIAAEDLEPAADLSTLGVDSLMSLAILARLREAGIDLPTSFFLENRTMSDVFRGLARNLGVETPQTQASSASSNTESFSQSTFKSRPIPLQRRSNPASTANLFLFPDGSGMPFAYAALDTIGPDLDVYGLVCPFIDAPDQYSIGIEGTVNIYLDAIKQKQGHGPYHLGGWFVGGVLAYEASKQLLEAGRTVNSLILIDAPCPLTLPPMPASLIDRLAAKGVFSQFEDIPGPGREERKGKRQSLLAHFDATVKNLAGYRPSAIIAPPGSLPSTLIVWAQEGVDPSASSSLASLNPTESWILEDRGSNIGSHGWDLLLPAQKSSTRSVSGNHFTMMIGQNVSALPSGVCRGHKGSTQC
jgi:iron transport multicopper oxidase